jgi:hypothetical protein
MMGKLKEWFGDDFEPLIPKPPPPQPQPKQNYPFSQ